MEKKKYVHPHICVCSRCEGTGIIEKYSVEDVLRMHPTTSNCDLCEGTGRVVIKQEIITTIIAYDPHKPITLQ